MKMPHSGGESNHTTVTVDLFNSKPEEMPAIRIKSHKDEHGSKLILSVGVDSHQHRITIELHQFCHHKSEIVEGASSKILY